MSCKKIVHGLVTKACGYEKLEAKNSVHTA